ncbi:MAG: hypothetical protein ACOC1F_06800, partial [Myxococcota bacterium]
TGAVRFATTVTSATTLEYPIVGDVDGDGHAEVVVTSDGSMTDCEAEAQLGLEPGAPTQGVLIFEDAEDRWQPARAIWNQHTYHVTNVDDDGTVPDEEFASYEFVNSFREQVALAPDLTARASCTSTEEACLLRGEACNRGTTAAAAGATATFYDGDPRDGGAALCTVTVSTIDVGTCVAVECEPEHGAEAVWLGVDVADGGECETGNNYALIGPTSC